MVRFKCDYRKWIGAPLFLDPCGRKKDDYEKLRKNEMSRKRTHVERKRDNEDHMGELSEKRMTLLEYDGLGARCMSQEQYTSGFLPWVVSVGCTRSATGARSPVDSIVSSVSHDVLPSSVELCRFRMFRHIRIKYAAS